MVTFLFGTQNHQAGAWFAGLDTVLRRFNAVIDGIAHQMHQWISQRLHQVFVQVGLFTLHFQADFFFQTARQIPHHTRKTAKDLFDRLHAGLHHRRLQVGRHHIQITDNLGEFFILCGQFQRRHAIAIHTHRGLGRGGFLGGRFGFGLWLQVCFP